MFSDIAIPKNNEAEFIEIATKLDIKKLYFLYEFNEYNQKSKIFGVPKIADFRDNQEKVSKKLDNIESNTNLEIGFIVNQKNINKAMQQSKLLVVKSSDKDRFFIESGKIKIIYGFEEIHKRDYMHQRASGLNHIICELASKNNVAVGFSYSSLFNKNPADTPMLIGRMMQNITLCRKYKVNTIIGSFSEKPFDLRAHHDLISLFSLLGMNIKNIKESIAMGL